MLLLSYFNELSARAYKEHMHTLTSKARTTNYIWMFFEISSKSIVEKSMIWVCACKVDEKQYGLATKKFGGVTGE